MWALDGSDFPKHGSRWEWPGSPVDQLRRGPWPSQPVGTIGGHCICPRVGPRTKTGVRRRVCRRIGRATGQDGVGLGDGGAGTGAGPPEGWMGRDDAFGMSGPSGRACGLGDVVRWTHGRRLPDQCGSDWASSKRQAASVSPAMEQRSKLPEEAWRDYGGRGKPGTTQLPTGLGVRPAGARAKSTGPSTAGTGTAANPASCPMLRIPVGDPGIRASPVGVYRSS